MSFAFNETVADVVVANTTAETDLVSFSLPADQTKPGFVFRSRAVGRVLNNTGATVGFTFRVYFGGTLIHSAGAANLGTNADPRPWSFDDEIVITPTKQHLFGYQVVGPPLSMGSTNSQRVDIHTESQDIDVDKMVRLTVEMGTADPAATCTLNYAYLIEVI